MRESDSRVTKHTKYFNSCNADYLYTAQIATVSLNVLPKKLGNWNSKRANFVNYALNYNAHAHANRTREHPCANNELQQP